VQFNDKTEIWVDALRSGKYKQGTGQLQEEILTTNADAEDEFIPAGKFCCLGVACEALNFNYANSDGMIESHENALALGLDDYGYFSAPPDDVEEGLILNDQDDLATLNDTFHWSFEQIADALEACKTDPLFLRLTVERLTQAREAGS